MDIMQIKKKSRELWKKQNVVGYGFGTKYCKGRSLDKRCLTVLVSKKKNLSELSAHDVVPDSIDGLDTDVIEVGHIRALDSKHEVTPKTLEDHTSKWRPAIGGISVGHHSITAGTLGCIVYKDGEPFILSNNHVLADSNLASIGDAIIQPGSYDGGSMSDKIATLHSFVPISFDTMSPICKIAIFALRVLNWLTTMFKPNYKWSLVKKNSSLNFVDAALAKPLSNDLISDLILEIGKVNKGVIAEVDMMVKKSGRTTGYTEGFVEVLDAQVEVDYGPQGSAIFDGQIIAGPISQGGDSGSLVLDIDNNAVGLLFAGSDTVTIINPIDKVLEALDCSLHSDV